MTRRIGPGAAHQLGLAGLHKGAKKRNPTAMSSLRLLPKRKPIDRRVFLEPELWEALTEIAEFHSEVFREMGADEKVSRNDIISAFLDDGVSAYWEVVGGKPASMKDRAEKVKRYAEQLGKQWSGQK